LYHPDLNFDTYFLLHTASVGLIASASVESSSCGSAYTVTIVASGSTEPYTCSVRDQLGALVTVPGNTFNATTPLTILGMAAGTYTYTVMDAEGCSIDFMKGGLGLGV
jgi:hypothetical protein